MKETEVDTHLAKTNLKKVIVKTVASSKTTTIIYYLATKGNG
ncbi:hypothetical protein [Levilactobacillus zymae]|nr:hypothetical protein [Levilactobacillus zymae]MDT6980623.1 hypothetical protein [Levilactobacillus zymae]